MDTRREHAGAGAWSRRLRLVRPVTAVVVVATAVFALAGIGSPLLGLSVFADTGTLASFSGYRDVLAGAQSQHNYQRDLVDSAMPNSILFGRAWRDGDFAGWNPYALGGAPLGGTPNLAIASPVSLPYWVLPGWLAPAYVRLLELICAIGGMYLFLRRLRLGVSAAWLGGLVFASSAFMVAWTGWPQTRVACLMPALLWALERLVQRPRAVEVVLVALPVAGMLLGGFPAVTGYALLTAAAYLLVRVLAERSGGWRETWPPVAARLAAAAGGVAAGAGLAAWQLLPWVHYMTTVFVEGRTQNPGEHIPATALLTAIAPYAFGTVNPARPPDWFGPLELVDAQSYVGAAALVLLTAALALPGAARRLLPPGVWWFVVGAGAVWTVAIYVGGPLLGALQRTSFLFSDNFVGRARSVLGLLIAVLAAVGFELLLRGRSRGLTRERRPWRESAARATQRSQDLRTLARVRLAYGVLVWCAMLVAGGLLYLAGRRVAVRATLQRRPGTPGPDYLAHLNGEVLVGLSIVAIATAGAAWLWWGGRDGVRRRRAHVVIAGGMALLIAAQALWWAQTYHPRTDRQTYYPLTPTQQFLAAHLGHERYFGTDGAIFGSVDTWVPLRGLHGHGFIDRDFAELADTLPGDQFQPPTTAITSEPNHAAAVAVHPVLDRAAVRYFVVPPEVRPFGHARSEPDDGTTVDLQPGRGVTVDFSAPGGLRGLGITPAALAPDVTEVLRAPQRPAPDEPARLEQPGPTPAVSPQSSAHLRVILRDRSGRVVATGERAASPRAGDDLDGGRSWLVPLAAEDVPAGTELTAELTALGPTPLRVSATAGRPTLALVASAADGLRLVYARESVIYERTRSLDRARWAATAIVAAERSERLALLAGGRLRPDQVVLAAPGPAGEGRPAQVTWVSDGLDEMVLSVRADGAGYLVLADAIQTGWRVTVDDAKATLREADHGFVAVFVPAGEHTVRFHYPGPTRGVGAWITGLTVLVLLAALAPMTRRESPRPLRPAGPALRA